MAIMISTSVMPDFFDLEVRVFINQFTVSASVVVKVAGVVERVT